MPDHTDNDILIEFVRIGSSIKVSAIDPKTGIEVSTIGPASASETQLAKAALAKLRYVIAKRQNAAPREK